MFYVNLPQVQSKAPHSYILIRHIETTMILATQFRRIPTVKDEDKMLTLIVLCTPEIKKSLSQQIYMFLYNIKRKKQELQRIQHMILYITKSPNHVKYI